MADVASKQQTTALFLSTTVTRTRRHTELTKKLTNLTGNLCCAREHSVQFLAQFFQTVKTAQFTLKCTGPFRYIQRHEEKTYFIPRNKSFIDNRRLCRDIQYEFHAIQTT
jgi:hypothetical protein